MFTNDIIFVTSQNRALALPPSRGIQHPEPHSYLDCELPKVTEKKTLNAFGGTFCMQLNVCEDSLRSTEEKSFEKVLLDVVFEISETFEKFLLFLCFPDSCYVLWQMQGDSHFSSEEGKLVFV